MRALLTHGARVCLAVRLVVCLVVCLALPAAAQATAKKAAAPAKAPACPQACTAPSSAIETLVRAVASALREVPDGTVVASAAIESDAPAPRADALLALLLEHTAGRLGPAVRIEPSARKLAEARKSARGAPAIVLLRPRIARGRVHLRADAYAVPRTVWARARSPEPRAVAHAHAQAPIDAEVRSYLEPLAFEEPAITKYDGADPDIVALACGDLDGDAVADVVTMTRRRLLSVRLRQGEIVRLREARWEVLAPVAPVPLRQPLGFVTIVEPLHGAGRGGYLDAALTDRAGSVRLDARLALVKRMQGKALPVVRATACTWVHDLLLGAKLASCDEQDPALPFANVEHASDAFASTYLVAPDGSGRSVVALRHDGALVVRMHRGAEAPEELVIGRSGAQIAIDDLDQDGALETISTIDVLSPRYDALEVRTLLPSGTVKLRYRVPVPRGVRAVGACPPDGAGRAPVVLATGRQLWVVR